MSIEKCEDMSGFFSYLVFMEKVELKVYANNNSDNENNK